VRAVDFSPHLLRGLGALAGLASGLGAARLADALPARYGIRPLTVGTARMRRNVVVIGLAVAIGACLAHFVAAAPNTTVERGLFYFTTNLVLAVALVSAAAVDLEHMVLPNEITLGGAALALVTSYWRGIGLAGALIGVVVGLALTYLPFLLYKKLRGRSGMGLGDAKLALLAGAWLGAEGALFVVFAGALQSVLCAGVMRVLGLSFAVPPSVQAELAELREQAKAGDPGAREALADDPMAADVGEEGRGPDLATMRLPMGPFLVVSCLEFLFARGPILTFVARLLGP
jgi:leader peptidase (prepilin peptidase)/N-methyltransferase